MKKEISDWLLLAISLLISIFLFYVLYLSIDLKNPKDIHTFSYIILLCAIFFPIIPFVQKIRLGKFVELERDLQNQREEIKNIKNEIFQVMMFVNNTISSVNNLNNSTNMNFYFAELLDAAKEQFNRGDPKLKPQEIQEVRRELFLEDEDIVMALARMRIRIESLLRSILGKNTKFDAKKKVNNTKLYSATTLFKLFIHQYRDYEYLEQSFEYVNRICNAAIHGQQVPYNQAQEALNLGAKLISVLDQVYKK